MAPIGMAMIVFDGKTRLICSLACGDLKTLRHEMLSEGAAGADLFEFRLDYIQPLPTPAELDELLAASPRPAIVTCRSFRSGGLYRGPEEARLQLLLVDIDADTAPTDFPHDQAILSVHDFGGNLTDLESLADRFESSPAAVSKIAFIAAGPQDALRALGVLRRCRKPTISLAMGEAGIASRILAKKFGAFATFAAVRRGKESAPGQPTVDELKNLYRWDRIGPATAVYGVIGCPISHSLSPAIHNAAFEAVGLDAVYVRLEVQPGADNFKRFMDALLERPWLDWRGLSVTLPHKENAMAYIGRDRCDELSAQIGAINTITIDQDGLRGDNTDYAAAIDSLCAEMLIQRRDLRGRAVAVIGAGGSARAILAALKHYGADVTVYNRTPNRAEQLAGEFDCPFHTLEKLPHTKAEILINCTPIGMHPHDNDSPLEEIPTSVRAVFDVIYSPIETRLLREARADGCTTIAGLDMFVRQACAQFEIWTGQTAPLEVMRQVTIKKLTRQL
jgi:3-dehydroquinate dehydratase/shikimate dehydrogenase